MIPLWTIIPFPPESVEIAMMKPKHWIGRRDRCIRHGSTHPDMHGAVDPVNEGREFIVCCLRHRAGCNTGSWPAPESIHDIVVAPGWKCEQLGLQVAQPRSLGGNVKAAAQFHSASDALRSNRLIMTNRKFFEAGVTAALAHARPQERADAACNLSLLKCPQRRPPPPRWLKKLDFETRPPAVEFPGSRVGGFRRKLPVTRPAQAPPNKTESRSVAIQGVSGGHRPDRGPSFRFTSCRT